MNYRHCFFSKVCLLQQSRNRVEKKQWNIQLTGLMIAFKHTGFKINPTPNSGLVLFPQSNSFIFPTWFSGSLGYLQLTMACIYSNSPSVQITGLSYQIWLAIISLSTLIPFHTAQLLILPSLFKRD